MATEGIVFDVGVLTHYLKGVTDVRQARGQRYSLEFLLILIILAKLAGENKPKGIADWLRLRREQLVKAFRRKRATVPAFGEALEPSFPTKQAISIGREWLRSSN